MLAVAGREGGRVVHGVRVGDYMWVAGGRRVAKGDGCEMGGERALYGICKEDGLGESGHMLREG